MTVSFESLKHDRMSVLLESLSIYYCDGRAGCRSLLRWPFPSCTKIIVLRFLSFVNYSLSLLSVICLTASLLVLFIHRRYIIVYYVNLYHVLHILVLGIFPLLLFITTNSNVGN